MAVQVDTTKAWAAGEGTPEKYEIHVAGTVDLTNIRAQGSGFIGDVSIDVDVTVTNHPDNSRNSFAAADFAALCFGDIDVESDYPLPDRNLYGEALLCPTNLPVNKTAFEFRGDTWRANGPNRVSLWTFNDGYTINSQTADASWTRHVNMTRSISLSGAPSQPVLRLALSGAGPDSTGWYTQETWFSAADFYNTIRFDANGGTGAPAQMDVPISDPTFTLPDQVPTRKGWEFLGWNRDRDASTGEFQPGGTYPNNMLGVTTLYAIWDYTYRPGAMLDGGTWCSHDADTNEQGGKYMTQLGHADIMYDNEWVEMRTRTNKVGLQYAPSELLNNEWESQALDGYRGFPHDIGY